MVSPTPTVCAVIVAAGSGSRYGGEIPKQFLSLGGKTVLQHSIDIFAATFPGAPLVAVLPPECPARYVPQGCLCAHGGATRAESVRNGLSALGHMPEGSVVMIHDGARPLVGAALLRRLAEASGGVRGAVPATAMTDSMVTLGPDGTFAPVARANFRAVQTPQVFPLDVISNLYLNEDVASFTDELSAVRALADLPAVLVEGDPENIKITNPGDLAIAETILSRRCSHWQNTI